MPFISVHDVLRAAEFSETQVKSLHIAREMYWEQELLKPYGSVDSFFDKPQLLDVMLHHIDVLRTKYKIPCLYDDTKWRERLAASAFWKDLEARVLKINAIIAPALKTMEKAVDDLADLKDDLANQAIQEYRRGELSELDLPTLQKPNEHIRCCVSNILDKHYTAGKFNLTVKSVLLNYRWFLSQNPHTKIMLTDRADLPTTDDAIELSRHGFLVSTRDGKLVIEFDEERAGKNEYRICMELL
jgi:hypothetical protein